MRFATGDRVVDVWGNHGTVVKTADYSMYVDFDGEELFRRPFQVRHEELPPVPDGHDGWWENCRCLRDPSCPDCLGTGEVPSDE